MTLLRVLKTHGAGWWRAFLFGGLFLISGSARASEVEQQLQHEAERQGLAGHEQWHALMHYRGNPKRPKKSRVLNEEFFLHIDGRTVPTAELKATIARYFDPVIEDDESHPRCRFPARYEWLKRHLTFPEEGDPEPQCPRLTAWRESTSAGFASLVFVDGYFGNPASFFGHALLVFGNHNQSKEELLNTSVNYGAIVPENENGLVYIFRGLFGGYKAAFSSLDFFHHEFNYSDVSQRNMWRFELDVSQDDIRLLESHVWELSEVEFRYYFLRDNCGFEMMELGRVVLPDLDVPWKPWFAPLDLFIGLDAIRGANGAPLKVTGRPSRAEQFRTQYWNAEQKQRSVIKGQARQSLNGAPASTGPEFVHEPVVLDTLLLFSELPGVAARDHVPEWRQEWLRQRVALPAKSREIASTANPPGGRQRTTMVSMGAGLFPSGQVGATLRFRPAYTDLTAVGTDVQDAYALTAGDVVGRVTPRTIQVTSFDLLRVESMGIPSTPIVHKRDYAWRLRAGGRSRTLDCSRCFDAYLEGGWGKGVRLGRWGAASLLAATKLRTAPAQAGQVGVGPAVVFLAHLGKSFRTELRFDRRYFLGSKNVENEWAAVQRIGHSPHYDFWVRAEGLDKENIGGSGASFYW